MANNATKAACGTIGAPVPVGPATPVPLLVITALEIGYGAADDVVTAVVDSTTTTAGVDDEEDSNDKGALKDTYCAIVVGTAAVDDVGPSVVDGIPSTAVVVGGAVASEARVEVTVF
ncbi:MAG: hypothetical protein Q9220_006966 [cf. Caloplaca sp. 1 TL-2023]